ncbi:MAG: type II secretion system protein [Thermodesulfobacteriota bacterium]
MRAARKGFTLVELAVVLVIMGLIGYVFYGAIFEYLKREKISMAQEQLEGVVTQLQGVAVAQGTLPDPAVGGLLPTSYAYSTDLWRSRVRYWLAPELAGGAAISGVTATTLSVEEYSALGPAGTFVGGTLDRTVTNVAFVLANLGSDLTLQVEDVGGAGATIRILTRGYGDITVGAVAVRYDDQAVYQTLNQMQAILLQ